MESTTPKYAYPRKNDRHTELEFLKYANLSMNALLPASREPRFELRASGFPFCALRTSYRRYLHAEGRFDVRENFGSMYYTSVGTAAHLAFQRFLGQGGQIYGAWKCKCGAEKVFSNKGTCRRCGKEMEYEELTVNFGTYMSGHVDGLWRSADGEWFVLDYKTSSVFSVEKGKKDKDKFPYHGNMCQISAYAALLEQKLGITIAGWILFYLARDAPAMTNKAVVRRVTDKAKSYQLELMSTYDRHYGYLQTGLTKKRLIRIIEEKPCASYCQYEEEYAGLNPCELAPVCFNRDLLEDTVMDMLK